MFCLMFYLIGMDFKVFEVAVTSKELYSVLLGLS